MRAALFVTLVLTPLVPAADFEREVMAALARGGCNQGACHGNLNGKGGFKLSLRGDDPAADYRTLTRDGLARRGDPYQPANSLLLLKAVAAVPHEGGRRFGPTDAEYRTLHDWIATGMPASPSDQPRLQKLSMSPGERVLVEPAGEVRLKVTAHFADGSTRDVTRLAAFDVANPAVARVTPAGVAERLASGETSVLARYMNRQATTRLAFVPARPDYHWPDGLTPRTKIDEHVFAKLKAVRILPSGVADDSTFLRRLFLDALGVLPTAAEAKAFLDDASPDKRAKWIDRVLARPEFADYWALKWCDLLHAEEKTLDGKGVKVFHGWLREQVAADVPLTELARAVVAGRGQTYSQPAANFLRALREPQARSEAVAQVFLGVRLQCAKCHNHPFDRWTQNDYHQLAAFFARVQYRVIENKNTDRNDKHAFDGEQVVWQDHTSELPHPRTNKPLVPKFLGQQTPPLPADADRLQALADWIAGPDNPFFAQSQANRVWFHLLGRGLVEPDDDFRMSNPASNPALLAELAAEFKAGGFRLKPLVRNVLNSQTYQLAAAPTASNRDDEANFARALVQPLEAEQLLDGLSQVLDRPVKFDGYPLGTRAGQLPDAQVGKRGFRDPGARFLKTFGKPDRLLSCDCERTDDATLVQAFQLITGDLLQGLLTAPDNRIGRLMAAGATPDEMVEAFTLAALSRRPTARERDAAVKYVAAAANKRAAWEDVVWGVVNAKEFLLRH